MVNGYTRVASEDISPNVDSWLLEQIRKFREFLDGLQNPVAEKPTLLASGVGKQPKMGLESKTQQFVNDNPTGVYEGGN